MEKLTITKSDARKIILHASGLSRRGQFGKGRDAVYKLIDHLGFVQLDTNYVVERAHHHAIASRVPGYQLKWLEELQSEGKIFEFWTFAAGFMPMHDFRYSLPVKESFKLRRGVISATEANAMKKVLDRISREGPMMARDFENDRITKSKGWWDWRPSKIALERLHFDGRLMTTRVRNFHKVYDLPENLLPADLDLTPPTAEEFARYVIRRSLQMHGIAYFKEIAWFSKYVKNAPVIKEELKKLIDEGEVVEIQIQELRSSPLYMLAAYRKKKISLSNDVFVLSPFDILNVYRHRLRDFFDFDYQVECFVPAPKRKYGYFSLPILAGDTFAARMDSKADRKQSALVINNLHFEKVKVTVSTLEKISEAIAAFARFNQCERIELKKCNDKKAMAALRNRFNA